MCAGKAGYTVLVYPKFCIELCDYIFAYSNVPSKTVPCIALVVFRCVFFPLHMEAVWIMNSVADCCVCV